MTVRTPRRLARLRSAVSMRKSDSGVVTRMWGGRRAIAWRMEAGVSPVRTETVMGGSSRPVSAASARISASGSSRLRWMSLPSAFRGET